MYLLPLIVFYFILFTAHFMSLEHKIDCFHLRNAETISVFMRFLRCQSPFSVAVIKSSSPATHAMQTFTENDSSLIV